MVHFTRQPSKNKHLCPTVDLSSYQCHRRSKLYHTMNVAIRSHPTIRELRDSGENKPQAFPKMSGEQHAKCRQLSVKEGVPLRGQAEQWILFSGPVQTWEGTVFVLNLFRASLDLLDKYLLDTYKVGVPTLVHLSYCGDERVFSSLD